MKVDKKTCLDKIHNGIRSVLFNLGSLVQGEALCIVSDTGTCEIGEEFSHIAKDAGVACEHLIIPQMKMHGEEPSKDIFDAMQHSNLVIGLTEMSMAHTAARKKANENGVRYLSMPDYSLELLVSDAIAFDFKGILPEVMNLTKAFDNATQIEIRTDSGTELFLDATDRKGNCCPGFVNDTFLLGSPPDVESNVTLIENKSHGTIVVDGSVPIPEIGYLDTPITLYIENGLIDSIESKNKTNVALLNNIFDSYGPESRILAELGVGFNKNAKLCGNMLVDEGAYGTIHLGFGSNIFLGGNNSAECHIDFVFFADKLLFNDIEYRI